MLRSLKFVWLLAAVAILASALPATAAPVLSSISPTSGYPGTQVTYTGTGFGATQGTGSVWLGNKLAGSIVSWSDTQIVAVVAATAASGSAQVQQGGTWSNSIAFTVIKPNITSVSPTSGYPGNQVTINGTNFGATQGTGSVWLGNKLAGSIVSWSNTQIVATIAATAASGSVQVQQMGVWGNSIAFTVITPNITSVTPTTAYPGAEVTINGTNFGATQGSGSVWLGNKLAGSIVSWSNTQIVANVSATAASGSAQVQQGGVWSNSIAFTVITPSLTSISPTTARAGDSITLNGTNFGATQGTGSVWLGSKLAGSIVSWSNTQIVATVASGAISGNAIVQQGGVWSNSIALTVLTPTLSSIDPTTALAGDEITLTGTNFGATQGSGSVWLGSKLAGSIVSWSDTQIVATVASGSIPGTAQVQQGGVWSNSIALDVIIPVVTELDPESGPPGSAVTISGTGFGASQGDGKVWIGTKYATVVSWSDTLISATLAFDSETGYAQVYQNGVWSNTLPFEVTDCAVAEDPDDLQDGDVVWIDDDGEPAGTTVGPEGIVWSTYQKMHGTMAFHAVDAGPGETGLRTVSFTGLNAVIAMNHDVFLDVLTEECAPSQQVIVTLQTDDGPRTAYWGPNVANLGPEAVQVSEDPIEPGYWQRLDLDPENHDFSDRTITGITVEHVDGRVWFDYIGVNVPPPCGPPAPDDVTGEFDPLDVLFIEDAFPAGTTVDAPGVTWDTTYHAGGTQSFTHASPDYEQPQTISLTGFDPAFPVNPNDTLFVWVLIDGCEIPLQLKVTWKTSAGDKVVWYGSNGDFYGTGGVYGGNMPQAGQWRRLAVTASALNLYNASINGVVLENYGGHVWWDHAGHTLGGGCLSESWQDRPNTIHNDDELWIDEEFPAGATVDAPGLIWSDRQRSTGDLSFNYPDLDNHDLQHISVQDFTPIEIDPNGFLFAYIFQNSCNPPLQIVLTWETSAGPKSAYWGDNLLGSTGVDMGPLPTRRRSWERLEVPASMLGIEEGDTVDGITIDQYGGHSFYDTIGARPECILTEIAPATDFDPADVIWIEDETPAGVVAHDVDFVTDQKTSGTASFTSADPFTDGVNTLSFDFPEDFFSYNDDDSLVFYTLLDPCNPPRQVLFKFTSSESESTASYGDPIVPAAINGPIFPSGVWHRFSIPVGTFRPENTSIPVTLEISTVDGRAWFDRFGKTVPTPGIQSFYIEEEPEFHTGQSVTAHIVLDLPAPAGGAVVTLAEENPDFVTAPSSVTVPEGETETTINFTLGGPVSAPEYVGVIATYGADERIVDGMLLPDPLPEIASLTFTPSTSVGGELVTAEVTLTEPAPEPMVIEFFSSFDPLLPSPQPLTIAMGETSAQTSIRLGYVLETTMHDLTAYTDDSDAMATMTIEPTAIQLDSVSATPTELAGSNTAIVTATLTDEAPAGGIYVDLYGPILLYGTSTPLKRPAFLFVPEGEISASFEFETPIVEVAQSLGFTVAYGGVELGTGVWTTPPAANFVSELTVPSPRTAGGNLVTATLTLDAPAGAGGAEILLDSSNATVATVPVSVTVPEGETTVTFDIDTDAVTEVTDVTILATYEGIVQRVLLGVLPAPSTPALVSLTIPNEVIGSLDLTGTVTISEPAPVGGLTITLAGSHPRYCSVPASVTIPEGETSADFTVTTYATYLTRNIHVVVTYQGQVRKSLMLITGWPE